MRDRLVRKRLIQRQRARADRRSVLVSIPAPARKVVDQATGWRRELIANILSRLPA
jgi:DNA-binding MarR family transcriptional regulator